MSADAWETHVRYCSKCSASGPGCSAGRRYYDRALISGGARRETRRSSGRSGPTLDDALARGYRVETDGQDYIVLTKGEPVNHVLHLLASVFTLGLWIIPWIFIAGTGGQTRMTVRKGD